MLRVYANHYMNIGASLHDISSVFYAREETDPITNEEKADLKLLLTELKRTCDEVELPVSSGMLARAVGDLPENSHEIDTLMAMVKQEIQSHLFLFIPSHRARYYEPNNVLEAKMVAALPTASKEILHAGNCYAVGEYTACVFHAMRAAELGLRAVSKHLNVTLPTPLEKADWHTLIDQIEVKLKALNQQTKTPAVDAEMKLFSEANSQFLSFKEAFRKHVSHARADYEEVPSISIYHRSRELLQVLSTRIAE